MHCRLIVTTLMLLALALTLCLTEDSASGEKAEPYIIYVEVDQKRLTVWQGDDEVGRYTVATGAWDTPTPIGVFRINSRFHGEMSGFGTCFLGINVPWGQYGIHGTNKPETIGYNASHGCVRMKVSDAEALYRLVPNGTKVVIQGSAYGELGDSLRPLQSGDRSSAVRALQRKLRALGYYTGWPDGVYGEGTERAVHRAREALGLPLTDGVDWSFYQAIGLTLFE